MVHMADTTTAQKVAELVARRIDESGVTLTWLCEHSGIPRTTLMRRLRGTTPFDLNELDRIATALRIPTTDLLADTTHAA